MYIANWLVENLEKEKLATVFRQLDTNSDGVLSKQEIKKGFMQHYGRLISDRELTVMFEQVDCNQSGQIDLAEFLTASLNQKLMLTENRLKFAFRMLDKDGSGTIDAAEIKFLFKKLP